MKRFVEGLDRSQRTLFPETLEDFVAEDNAVRVNCVLPGTIRTPEVDERYDLTANEAALAEKVLAGRIGEPEEVADVIRFLISDEGGYINGQKLIVDGGSFLY
jgi:NAD(P)-dependent dehydrogenase (short-subunit alcohol dehydrogenase family)